MTSEDPYEILGVPRDANEAALKRAYAELVRKHRPDRSPEDFGRIQRAYEAALDALGMPAWAREPLPAARERGKDLAAAWRLVGDGDADEARSRLRQVDSGLAFAHAFLLDEMLGRPFEQAAQHLVAAARSGVDSWIDRVLRPGERTRFLLRTDVSWRDLGPALCEARIEEHLLRGDLEKVLAEVRGEDYRAQAARDSSLHRCAMKVACAAVWDFPHEAELLAAHHAREHECGWFEEGFDQRLSLRAQWERWQATDPPAALARMLRLAHVVPPSELVGGRWSWRQVFASLERMDRGLVLLLVDALDDGVEPELSEEDEAHARAFMHSTDRELASDLANRIDFAVFAMFFVVLLFAFVEFGFVTGLLLLGAWLYVWWKSAGRQDRWFYRQVVRPAMVDVVVRHGLPPVRVAEFVEKHAKRSSDIQSFPDDIERDLRLAALWQLVRLTTPRP